jgi:hypothetical protein
LAVLLLTHGPRDRVVGPVVGGKDVMRLLHAGCGYKRLLSSLGPACA